MGIRIAREPRSSAKPATHAKGTDAPWWNRRWNIGAAALASAVLYLFPTGSGRAEPPEAAASQNSAPAVLQIKEDVEIGSTIVRLGDVLSPAGRVPEGWQRASGAPIGLLPADGRRLRIERQRLMEMLERLKLIGEPVRLSGSEAVGIRYVSRIATVAPPEWPRAIDAEESTDPAAEPRGATPPQRTPAPRDVAVRRTNYSADASRRLERSSGDGSRNAVDPLAPAERNRIRRMIHSAFERTHAEIIATAELRIDESDTNLDALDGIRGIRSLRLSGKPDDQDLRLIVSGDTELAQIEATVRIAIDDLPMAVVTTQPLTRGDLIAARDVQLEAVPRHRYSDDLITNVESIVGMEIKRSLSAGRTVRLDDVTAPIVIRRGELVELRVVGGGVTVATAARALGSAAEGEPVTVETQSPRRRHLARAVASGVVEILTRPPSTAHPAQRSSNR